MFLDMSLLEIFSVDKKMVYHDLHVWENVIVERDINIFENVLNGFLATTW